MNCFVFKRLLAILFVLFQTANVFGSHSMGAELTYQCLGGNQYRLYYYFYRDCSGIPAPSSVNVNFTSSCFSGGNVNLIPTPVSPTQIAPICPAFVTTCNGGPYTGIEEWIYTGVVNLPGPCSDWYFSYSECCRNASITTVPGATSYNLYVFSFLNNSDVSCNNSPSFNNRPVQLICQGQNYCLNNGATDIDGDSLTYQLISPLAATGTPITYSWPYSFSQPIVSSPPAVFNPQTGTLCVVPQQTDVSPFAVLVSEYRNGILIGQVERDIQIEVMPCSNFIPTMSGLAGTSNYSVNLCAGTTYDFYIGSFDADAGQQTSIVWNSTIPGSQVVNSGGHRDTLHFTWTPTLSDISGTPYCEAAYVSDDNCPFVGLRVYNYCFTVLPPGSPSCIISGVNEGPEGNRSEVKIHSENNRYRFQWDESNLYSRARIFDSSGRMIKEMNTEKQNSALFNFENFSEGIYLICLDGKDHWCHRLLID